MFKKIAITAIAIAISAPAFAMSGTQLERSLGVEAGAYTLSQLTALDGNDERNDFERQLSFFDANGDVSVTRSADTSAYVPLKSHSRGSDR